MERITKEQVRHVAELARLSFTDKEIEELAYELDEIIEHAEMHNEISTENILPMAHVLDVRNVLREDEVKASLPVEDVLRLAPDHEDDQIKVPAIIE